MKKEKFPISAFAASVFLLIGFVTSWINSDFENLSPYMIFEKGNFDAFGNVAYGFLIMIAGTVGFWLSAFFAKSHSKNGVENILKFLPSLGLTIVLVIWGQKIQEVNSVYSSKVSTETAGPGLYFSVVGAYWLLIDLLYSVLYRPAKDGN